MDTTFGKDPRNSRQRLFYMDIYFLSLLRMSEVKGLHRLYESRTVGKIPLVIASVLIAQQLRRLNGSAGRSDSQSLGSMRPCIKPS